MLAINAEDLGIIRITSAPRGRAPLMNRDALMGIEIPSAIRKAWVGIAISCICSHDGALMYESETIEDVVTGLGVTNSPGYLVFQVDALTSLEKQSPEAAMFWMELGYPQHPAALFLFDFGSAEVMKPMLTRIEFFAKYSRMQYTPSNKEPQ
jgi:hypothetical protein